MRNLYKTYQSKNAKSRGLQFELTFEQFQSLVTGRCHYCGLEPAGKLKRHNWKTLHYNGIDRLDSAKGYTIDNVVSCCKYCNRAKRDSTYKEFRNWIRQVYHYWGNANA